MLIFSGALTACANLGNFDVVAGSGNVTTESRDVSGFTRVTLQGMGTVTIDQTGTESMTITADDNFLPYLETVVEGDTLFIRTTEAVAFRDVTQLDFEISAAALDGVTLQGAGNINVRNLTTNRWEVRLPGAGQITVAGETGDQTVELSGAGSYQAENLVSRNAEIRSSGAGEAVVRVSDTLDVTIDGLGSVEYIGSPVVTQEINGVGTVQQRP
jgi:hypothetical protein